MTRSRGLGRGLDALIPSSVGGGGEVDVDLIVPNPYQPRTSISDHSLEELTQSIREHGIIQPLLVSPGHPEGTYQLISGERRLQAARLAGLRRVPVLIRETAMHEQLELALVENLQRHDLMPLEEAQAFSRLGEEFGMTQKAIADRVGRSRPAIANAIRLLALSDEIKGSLAAGQITEGHARALLALDDEEARLLAWRQMTERGLTVRQTEELVRRWPSRQPTSSPRPSRAPNPETEALESELRESLGTKVELRRTSKGRGRLVLHFYSDEELEGLLARLGAAVD